MFDLGKMYGESQAARQSLKQVNNCMHYNTRLTINCKLSRANRIDLKMVIFLSRP